MFRVILDGTIYDSPTDWTELKSVFKRDDKNNTILLTTDGQYSFAGDAYAYLVGLINSVGFCTSVDVSIQQNCSNDWIQIISGNIFLSDCEVNERSCIITTTIQDNSFYAKINNNKNIKTSPQAGRSKNNIPITASSTYELDIYRISNNALLKSNIPAIRIYDVFRYFIDFVSDGSLTFASDTFDIGGEWEGLCIVTGKRLRLNSLEDFDIFSLATVLNEVNNKIPIILAVENVNGSKFVRIESESYFNQTSVVYSFTDIDEVNSKFDTQKLYSVVKFGGQTTDLFSPLNIDQIPFFGFNEEEFGVLGVCNIDNTLDLSCDWISASYLIYQVVETASQDYDANIFLIDSILSSSTSGRTRNTNYFQTSPAQYQYNELLTNYQTALRYFDKIPTAIASFFAPVGTGTFKATIDQTLGTIVIHGTFPVLQFDNVVYNIGGYYDGVNDFTALLTGIYSHEVSITVNVTNASTGIVFILKLRVFDGGGGFQDDIWLSQYTISGTGTYTFGGTFDLMMPEGYTAIVRLEMLPGVNPIAFTFNNSSFWEVADNTVDGAVWQTYDADTFPIRTHEFDYPLTKSEFESIIASPYGYAEFSMAGQLPRKGLIREIQYNHAKATASVKLLTNKATIDVT